MPDRCRGLGLRGFCGSQVRFDHLADGTTRKQHEFVPAHHSQGASIGRVDKRSCFRYKEKFKDLVHVISEGAEHVALN